LLVPLRLYRHGLHALPVRDNGPHRLPSEEPLMRDAESARRFQFASERAITSDAPNDFARRAAASPTFTANTAFLKSWYCNVVISSATGSRFASSPSTSSPPGPTTFSIAAGMMLSKIVASLNPRSLSDSSSLRGGCAVFASDHSLRGSARNVKITV